MHRSRRPRPLPSTGAKRDVVQTARVFKSGNSLAVRIPGGIAKQLDIREGIGMEISLDDGRIRKRQNSALVSHYATRPARNYSAFLALTKAVGSRSGTGEPSPDVPPCARK